ncbi:MAG TPA: hypothetical protein VHR66_29875 [Gemmataceae bacterium]|jgi:hypothetical protein|nr:hypothetical protein [Gemmataceae bacterium]
MTIERNIRKFANRSFVEPDSFAAQSDEWLARVLINRKPLVLHQDKANLFSQYGAVNQQMDNDRAGVIHLINTSLKAAGHIETVQPPTGITKTTDFYLAEKPVADIHAILTQGIAQSARSLAQGSVGALNKLVGDGLIGLIEWSKSDPKVCHYFYTLSKTKTTEVTDRRGTTHTETRTMTGVLHDLVNANRHDYWTNQGPRIPHRVKAVLAATPDFMRSAVKVVGGDQIQEFTVTREVGRTSWFEPVPSPPAVRYDPAIVLFDLYVLAGWNADER